VFHRVHPARRRKKEIMFKRLVPALLGACLFLPAPASAAVTSNGTLGVTATVTNGIKLVFKSDASGVPLGGTGTDTATLAFGNIQAYGGGLSTGVTRTVNASSFTVSSPFNVNVTKANLVSTSYTLTAQLSAADAQDTFSVGGVTVTSAANATVLTTGTYDANVVLVLALTVPFTAAHGNNISDTLNFTATAN
jgi:hypothetical protein